MCAFHFTRVRVERPFEGEELRRGGREGERREKVGNEDTRVEIVPAIGEKKKKKTLVRHSLSLVFRSAKSRGSPRKLARLLSSPPTPPIPS